MNKLLNIRAENFRSIGKMNFQVEKQGMCQIIGINNDDNLSDSNGSGKSTIKAALCWCIFGVTETGLKADSVLNWDNPKNCKVSSKWIINGDTIEITRYRKHVTGKNDVNITINGMNANGADNARTQKLIEDTIGFSYKLFVLVLTAGATAKNMNNFLLMSDSERKDFISYLLNIDYLKDIQDEAKANVTKLENEITAVDVSVKTVEATQESENRALNYAKLQKDEYAETLQSNIDKTKQLITAYVQEISDLTTPKSELEAQLSSIKIITPEAVKQASTRVEDALRGVNKCKDIIADYNNSESQYKLSIAEIDNKLGNVESHIISTNEKAKAFKQTLTDAEFYIHTIKQNIKTTTLDIFAKTIVGGEELQKIRHSILSKSKGIVSNDSMIEVLKTQHAQLLGKFEAVESTVGTLCPTCQQTIQESSVSDIKDCLNAEMTEMCNKMAAIAQHTVELNDKVKSLEDKEIKLLNKMFKDFIKGLKSELKEEQSSLVKQTAIFDKRLKELVVEASGQLKEQQQTLESQIVELSKNRAECAVLLDKQISQHKIAKSFFQSLIDEQIAQNTEISTIKSELSILNTKVQGLHSGIKEAKVRIKQMTEEPNPHDATISTVKANLNTCKDKIVELGSLQAKLSNDIMYHKFWVYGFGNAGIKSFILDIIRNQLNNSATFCAGYLFDDDIRIDFVTQVTLKSGDIKDKFSVVINKGGNEVDYTELSKGEQNRVLFAVNYALRQLALNFHGVDINFVWYDEILDGLDASGVAQITELLKADQNQYESIFLVTHNVLLTDQFDNSITIHKTNGISSIVS